MKCPICADETVGQETQQWGPEFAHKRCVKAYSLGGCDARAAIAAHEAKQTAEPVAWYLPAEGGDDSLFRDHRTVIDCKGNPWEGWIPLYTHPQPAKREPLSEPAVLALYQKYGTARLDGFTAAIREAEQAITKGTP
jgi:hypothetical protein